jgi:hypothetical protein
VIHQGSYVTELLAFTACVIGLWELSPRLCAALVFVQAALTMVLYGFNSPLHNVSHQLNTRMLVLTFVSFALTIMSLWFVANATSTNIDEELPAGREWRTHVVSVPEVEKDDS